MAKRIYVGVDNIARKVKKAYIGVDGIARRIRKAYIGVGGVARPCFGSGELERYGTLEGTVAVSFLAAAPVGNYALFGGGYYYSDDDYNYETTNKVEYVDSSLTVGDAGTIETVANMASIYYNGEAVFAGGAHPLGSDTKQIYGFNENLSCATLGALTEAKAFMVAAIVGNPDASGSRMIIYGGESDNGLSTQTTIDAFDQEMTKTTHGKISIKNHAAASTDKYAFFGGGLYVNSLKSDVVVFDKDMTKSTAPALSESKYMLSAVGIEVEGDSYAIFAGGLPSGDMSATVEAYDSSLTKIILDDLSSPCAGSMAEATERYAVFGGGDRYENENVDVYDHSLTHSITEEGLSRMHISGASATIGCYVIFGKGTTFFDESGCYTSHSGYEVYEEL